MVSRTENYNSEHSIFYYTNQKDIAVTTSYKGLMNPGEESERNSSYTHKEPSEIRSTQRITSQHNEANERHQRGAPSHSQGWYKSNTNTMTPP